SRREGAWLVAVEVMPGHVHLLVEVDPQFGVHKAVKAVKGGTSRVLREEFPSLRSRLPTLWTNSSFVATTGGAPPGCREAPRDVEGTVAIQGKNATVVPIPRPSPHRRAPAEPSLGTGASAEVRPGSVPVDPADRRHYPQRHRVPRRRALVHLVLRRGRRGRGRCERQTTDRARPGRCGRGRHIRRRDVRPAVRDAGRDGPAQAVAATLVPVAAYPWPQPAIQATRRCTRRA